MKYYVDTVNGPPSHDWNSYADALRDLASTIDADHDRLLEMAEDQIEADGYTGEFESIYRAIEREIAAPTGTEYTTEFAGVTYHVRPTE